MNCIIAKHRKKTLRLPYYRIGLKSCTELISLFILTLIITSCAFLSGSPPGQSVNVASFIERGSNNWRFTLINQKPYIYKRLDNRSKPDIFLTVVRDCPDKEIKQPLPAIARQLFVGLKNFRRRKEEKLTIAGKNVLLWIADAQLEDQALDIASYSFKETDCIIDIILWSFQKKHKSEANFIHEIEEFSAYLVKSLPDFNSIDFSTAEIESS